MYTFKIAHGNRSGCTLDAVDGILLSGHVSPLKGTDLGGCLGAQAPLSK